MVGITHNGIRIVLISRHGDGVFVHQVTLTRSIKQQRCIQRYTASQIALPIAILSALALPYPENLGPTCRTCTLCC